MLKVEMAILFFFFFLTCMEKHCSECIDGYPLKLEQVVILLCTTSELRAAQFESPNGTHREKQSRNLSRDVYL